MFWCDLSWKQLGLRRAKGAGSTANLLCSLSPEGWHQEVTGLSWTRKFSWEEPSSFSRHYEQCRASLGHPVLPRLLWQLERGTREGSAVFSCSGALLYHKSDSWFHPFERLMQWSGFPGQILAEASPELEDSGWCKCLCTRWWCSREWRRFALGDGRALKQSHSPFLHSFFLGLNQYPWRTVNPGICGSRTLSCDDKRGSWKISKGLACWFLVPILRECNISCLCLSADYFSCSSCWETGPETHSSGGFKPSASRSTEAMVRITESQDDWDWKGHLKTKSPAKEGSFRAGYTATHPSGFWTSTQESPQLLWADCFSAVPLQIRKLFLIFRWNFLHFSLCPHPGYYNLSCAGIFLQLLKLWWQQLSPRHLL